MLCWLSSWLRNIPDSSLLTSASSAAQDIKGGVPPQSLPYKRWGAVVSGPLSRFFSRKFLFLSCVMTPPNPSPHPSPWMLNFFLEKEAFWGMRDALKVVSESPVDWRVVALTPASKLGMPWSSLKSLLIGSASLRWKTPLQRLPDKSETFSPNKISGDCAMTLSNTVLSLLNSLWCTWGIFF